MVWCGGSTENAPEGLLGPVRLDTARSADREIAVVRSDGACLLSAPVQLVPYAPRAGASVQQEIEAGRAVDLGGGELLTRRRIVTTGININEISKLDTRAGTFFVWLRYTGDATATDVTFANS